LQKKKKYLSKEDALKKMEQYCAYQDRCHSEVRNKLLQLGIYGDDLEEIIVALIADNFLNEERFAKSYVRGKFRMKHWGKMRLYRELKFRKISDYCIKKAMEEIPEEDYYEILEQVLLKKKRLTREENPFKLKLKLTQYGMSRGFEMDVIREVLKNLED
jgi:regulatory protein